MVTIILFNLRRLASKMHGRLHLCLLLEASESVLGTMG